MIVHSFSRFFRDAFDMEFYVRKLAKNGVKLVSITKEMGDDPMHLMVRQIMALFDEYQSKENAKHVLRAMNENARQGFWNGALPPIGYRIAPADQRVSNIRKKLEIDPLHADIVRLIYRLFLEGDGVGGANGGQGHHLLSRRTPHLHLLRRALGAGFDPSDFHPHDLYRRAQVQQRSQKDR